MSQAPTDVHSPLDSSTNLAGLALDAGTAVVNSELAPTSQPTLSSATAAAAAAAVGNTCAD